MEGSRVVLLLCLCGCALGVLDFPSASTPPAEVRDNTGERILDPLLEVWRGCMKPPACREVTSVLDLCVSLPDIRECLAREEATWNETHAEALNKVYVVVREEAVAAMDRLCANDAEKLNALHREYTSVEEDPDVREIVHDFMTGCVFYGSFGLGGVDKSPADLPSKVWYLYYQTRIFNVCIMRTLYKYNRLVELAVEQLDALLENMRCFDPTNEGLVLCKTIDPRQIDRAHLCPLKNISPGQRHVEDLMLKAFQCMWPAPFSPTLAQAKNFTDYLEFFNNYCKHTERFKHCKYESGTGAEICLNECEYRKFDLVQSDLHLAHEVGCHKEGKRLAVIFYKLRKIKVITPDVFAKMMQCLSDATEDGQLSLDIYLHYQELPDMKQCLIDAAPTATEFTTAVDEVFSEVRDRMQCFDNNDTVVLCKTIPTN